MRPSVQRQVRTPCLVLAQDTDEDTMLELLARWMGSTTATINSEHRTFVRLLILRRLLLCFVWSHSTRSPLPRPAPCAVTTVSSLCSGARQTPYVPKSGRRMGTPPHQRCPRSQGVPPLSRIRQACHMPLLPVQGIQIPRTGTASHRDRPDCKAT